MTITGTENGFLLINHDIQVSDFFINGLSLQDNAVAVML